MVGNKTIAQRYLLERGWIYSVHISCAAYPRPALYQTHLRVYFASFFTLFFHPVEGDCMFGLPP